MGVCEVCGSHEEVRFGICFDCATRGEEQMAKQTVLQHLGRAWLHARRGQWFYARMDISLAFERLTRTGDYAEGGTFDREGYRWRDR